MMTSLRQCFCCESTAISHFDDLPHLSERTHDSGIAQSGVSAPTTPRSVHPPGHESPRRSLISMGSFESPAEVKKYPNIMRAASLGDTNAVREFIFGGVDVNQRDDYGWSALARYVVPPSCSCLPFQSVF